MSPIDRHRVLVADDEESLRFVLSGLLKHEGCEVELASDGAEAIALAEAGSYDLYVLDVKMPKKSGMEVLHAVRRAHPDALVIMITAFGSQKLAIEALRGGAYDYFTKPFEIDELRVIFRRALEKQALLRKVSSLEQRLGHKEAFHRFIGASPKIQAVFDLVRRVSNHDVTVLITGESGVGKELVAEAIHEQSYGSDKPFVRVNCAAIPEPLLESELFGHKRGAFTGAVADKPGKFEVANGGSILLDEIGEMPLSLQAKLLRVLQEKKIERIGETSSRSIELRIMASTNRDLTRMIRNKTFREDLFFRINVLPIPVPPLRERIEDLPLLIDHFLAKHGRAEAQPITVVAPDALALLEAYPWPGNVRELENVIQRAIIMTQSDRIGVSSLPESVSGLSDAEALAPLAGDAEAAHAIEAMGEVILGPLSEQIDRLVEREEKRMIRAALDKMNHRRQETADLLGISRKSLHNKMHKYSLLKSKGR